MIVTCASCLTKYHLDDSRVSEKGAKVRCSRCKHIFYVVPPPETKEEVAETFESFARFHEELIGKEQAGIETPSLEEEQELATRPKGPPEEEVTEGEKFLFSDRPPEEKVESFSFSEPEKEIKPALRGLRAEKSVIEKRRIRWERRTSLRLMAFIIIVLLFVFGLFYLWTEIEAGGKLSSYLEAPFKKATWLWEKIWGTEKEGLIVKDLTGYEEKVGEVPLYMIEGKVENQSQKAKKFVRVKVVLFDQNRLKVAEKETSCGRTILRGELKSLPPHFFSGEMVIEPNTEKEMIVAPGKTIPFVVVFRDLPPQAKEFKVEIVEAPSL